MTSKVWFSEASCNANSNAAAEDSIVSMKLEDTKYEETGESKESNRKMSLFTIYAKIFRLMLANWIQAGDPNEDKHIRELDELVLPSNEEWRRQVYYRLVDLQREIDAEGDAMEMQSDAEKGRTNIKEWKWQPIAGTYPLRPKGPPKDTFAGSWEAIQSLNGSMTEACIQPGWRVGDLILAAKVLENQESPPIYADEAEMRRVFGLVYDVLRYKNILNHALEDVQFWYYHSECKCHERIVWLLLYDMQGRKFGRRGEVNEVMAREQAFEAAGLKHIEDALLEAKTRLAASVSRLRIGGAALTLGELLPLHLRTAEGAVWGENGAVATGWVNTLKLASKEEFVEMMKKLGLRLCDDSNKLDESTYTFDPLCPKVINFHDKARELIAKSELVQSHQFVFLERSLCLGAAVLAQAVRIGRLCGPVVLTHAIAPRHTGYLAGLLADIDDAGRLLVFGTAELRQAYEEYLFQLGVTLQQCRVFSEPYTSPPPSAELERATIVLAEPPSSYTGVRDAVDLAVARGGDAALLEALTDIEGGKRNPQALLAEQLSTLKHALTRPNVQLLVYESHSIFPSETTEMVGQVMQYANRMAVEKYVREHPPKRKPVAKDSGGRSVRSSKSGKRHQQSLEITKTQPEERRSVTTDEHEDETLLTAPMEGKVPDSDLFELGHVDEIFGSTAQDMIDKGCYLAIIRRKEMMQFNSLFMIKVAEAKGLFGDPNKQPQPEEEPQQAAPVPQGSQVSRKHGKRSKIQMDRITAPTFSSLVRNFKQSATCPRHNHHVSRDRRSNLEQRYPNTMDASAVEPCQQRLVCSRNWQSCYQENEQSLIASLYRRMPTRQQQDESVRHLTMSSESRSKQTKLKYYESPKLSAEIILKHIKLPVFKISNRISLERPQNYEQNRI